MNPDSSNPSPEDPNLSDLGRAVLGGGETEPSSPSMTSAHRAKAAWTPPSPEELQTLLPQYEIVAMLGRGGMGAVYMGRQISLDRPVAIKILSGALEDSDLGFKERFKNEARAMAKLSHPGIVAIYEFGETSDGLLYIVMEYIDGTDVARMIAAEGRLHTEYAMAITAHVCDALAYAHERGIIHRDIKPANIMVGYDGVVKVADFGLAKVHAADGQSLGLTMSGMAMGTMHYIAPEALSFDLTVDHRADIYAVGVMLYQMLTGKLPQGLFELPSLQIPGLDPRYDGIIAKSLREDREQRYPTIRELRGELDAILTQPVPRVEEVQTRAVAALPTMARPKRPGGRKKEIRHSPTTGPKHKVSQRSRTWMGWVVVAILAVLGGYAWVKRSENKTTTIADTSEPPSVSQDGWTDGLGAWWSGVKFHESFVRGSDGITRLMSDHATMFGLADSARPFKDQAVRATVKLEDESDSFSVAVRMTVHPDKKIDNYHVHLGRSSRVVRLARIVGSEHLGLKDILLPPDFDYDASHTLELGIVGDLLTVSLDGKKLVTHHDSLISSGGPSMSARRGAVIERFEFRSLDPVVPSAATSSSDATKDEAFVNSLGMKFVSVPGTEILMCIHETRRKDYFVYSAETPGAPGLLGNQTLEGFTVTDRSDEHPVVGLNWDDSQAFCAWLSKKEGRTYRLPTDREWSHAVGLGGVEAWSDETMPSTLTRKVADVWPWGTNWPPPIGAGNYSDSSRKANDPKSDAFYVDGFEDGYPTTAPVMSFSPNHLGIYDLGGNVWEWCEEWFDQTKTDRVLRGASWTNGDPFEMLSSHRHHFRFDARGPATGCRLVLEMTSTSTPKSSPVSTKPQATPAAPPVAILPIAPDGKPISAKAQSDTGSPIDLLALIDPARDTFNGTWKRTADGLSLEGDGNMGVPFAPPEEYDFEIEFSISTDSIGVVAQQLRFGGKPITWFMAGQAPGFRPVFGFGPVEGPESETQVNDPFRFTKGDRIRSTVRVRKDSLTGAVNGRDLVVWKADPAKIEAMRIPTLKEGVNLAFNAKDGGILFHRATLTPFAPGTELPTGPTTWTDTNGRTLTATFKAVESGQVLLDIAGKLTPVPFNTLSSESQKLARAFHEQAGKSTSGIAQEERVAKSEVAWNPLRKDSFADSRHISLRARFESGRHGGLTLRGSEEGEKPKSRYWAALQSNGREVVLFREWRDPGPGDSRFANSTLSRTSLKEAIPAGEEYTLTFTAIGDELKVLLNDTPVIEVVDDLLPGSFAGVMGEPVSGSVEWTPLSFPE